MIKEGKQMFGMSVPTVEGDVDFYNYANHAWMKTIPGRENIIDWLLCYKMEDGSLRYGVEYSDIIDSIPNVIFKSFQGFTSNQLKETKMILKSYIHPVHQWNSVKIYILRGRVADPTNDVIPVFHIFEHKVDMTEDIIFDFAYKCTVDISTNSRYSRNIRFFGAIMI